MFTYITGGPVVQQATVVVFIINLASSPGLSRLMMPAFQSASLKAGKGLRTRLKLTLCAYMRWLQ